MSRDEKQAVIIDATKQCGFNRCGLHHFPLANATPAPEPQVKLNREAGALQRQWIQAAAMTLEGVIKGNFSSSADTTKSAHY